MSGRHRRIRDDANIAFDRANFEKAFDERNAAREQEEPQPALTPEGDLRTSVDKAVREQTESIKAKLREDRAKSRTRER